MFECAVDKVKVSIVIPCLFKPELLDMIKTCVSGLPLDAQVILIGNDSYAVNVNNGLEAATGDYLVICNNDCEFVQLDWLEHLLKPLKEGYDISKEGYDISSIVTSDQGWETRDEITEDDRFGSLWAMKRIVYETLGGLDERFGLGNFEDADYYLRAKEAGFRIGKNWAGIVEHKGRATFDVVDPKHEIFETNKAKFIAKWGRLI